jgi:hypothetical protein
LVGRIPWWKQIAIQVTYKRPTATNMSTCFSLIKIYLGGDALLFLVGSFAKYPPSNLDIEKFKSYSWLLEEGVEKLCPFILCLSFKEYPPPNLGG